MKDKDYNNIFLLVHMLDFIDYNDRFYMFDSHRAWSHYLDSMSKRSTTFDELLTRLDFTELSAPNFTDTCTYTVSLLSFINHVIHFVPSCHFQLFLFNKN